MQPRLACNGKAFCLFCLIRHAIYTDMLTPIFLLVCETDWDITLPLFYLLVVLNPGPKQECSNKPKGSWGDCPAQKVLVAFRTLDNTRQESQCDVNVVSVGEVWLRPGRRSAWLTLDHLWVRGIRPVYNILLAHFLLSSKSLWQDQSTCSLPWKSSYAFFKGQKMDKGTGPLGLAIVCRAGELYNWGPGNFPRVILEYTRLLFCSALTSNLEL